MKVEKLKATGLPVVTWFNVQFDDVVISIPEFIVHIGIQPSHPQYIHYKLWWINRQLCECGDLPSIPIYEWYYRFYNYYVGNGDATIDDECFYSLCKIKGKTCSLYSDDNNAQHESTISGLKEQFLVLVDELKMIQAIPFKTEWKRSVDALYDPSSEVSGVKKPKNN